MLQMRVVRRRLGRTYHSARERLMGLVEQRRGIETAQRVQLDEVGMDAPGRMPYEPSPLLALRRGLRGREIRPADVFLDLGCGKGRVLVDAVQQPFGRVTGVELVPELVEQARANLARVDHACASAEVVCADVLEYEIPDDVTIVYLYNPFRGEIFREVMERIVASLDRAPRQVTLIYRSPFEHDLVLASGRFSLARDYSGIVPKSVGSALRVYESYEPARPGPSDGRPEPRGRATVDQPAQGWPAG
jgi:SAM-dependent methyltransferase